MIVMKFGGTSVQNEEAISRVIGIVKSRLREKPLVVVSAMSKVTRLLCELAQEAENQHTDNVHALLDQLSERHHGVARALLGEKPELLGQTLSKVDEICSSLSDFADGVCQIGELSDRSRARIVSTGEVLSSVIVAAAMNANGVKCHWTDARRIVLTDDNYLNARPDLALTEDNARRIIPVESKGSDVVLTQGFIATTKSGSPAVLGFEGSDYSAAIFGMALGAQRVEIWTDVDGMRSADPRVVPNTARIERISYDEAAEMAFLGARVLHPMTIEPARRKNIPIYVLNSMNPGGQGSAVVEDLNIPTGPKSIASRTDVDYIVVKAPVMRGVTGMFADVFAALKKYRIATSLVSVNESRLAFTAETLQPGLDEALDELRGMFDVTLYRDKGQISIVGKNVAFHKSLMNDILSLAGNVYLVSQGAAMMNISFVTDRDKVDEVVNSLHNVLF